MILASASLIQLLLAVLAVLAYGWVGLVGARVQGAKTRIWLSGAWGLHGLSILAGMLDVVLHFGFAQACSITVWLMVTVYLVERRLMPQLKLEQVLAGLGCLTLLMAWLFPGKLLPPSQSIWLPVHWALGIAAYGLFAVAVVHGWLMSRAEARIRQAKAPESNVPLLKLERLTFRFVAAGFVLLSATLLVGTVFGELVYGSDHAGWHWDHKRVFAILSWLMFAVLLFGRWQFGWRGKRALRMLYAGAALLLFAYVGSRFVMEVILERTA